MMSDYEHCTNAQPMTERSLDDKNGKARVRLTMIASVQQEVMTKRQADYEARRCSFGKHSRHLTSPKLS